MLNLIFILNTLILVSESTASKARYNTPTRTVSDYKSPCKVGMMEQQSPCGENEVYDSCPPIYPPLRCNVKEVLTVCGINPELGSPSCEPGCRCADSYYLNGSGDCITKEECLSGQSPIKCNSRSPGYSECINGGCAKWRCTDHGHVCVARGPCEVGCACQDSYKLSPAGTCIPADPCPRSHIITPNSVEV